MSLLVPAPPRRFASPGFVSRVAPGGTLLRAARWGTRPTVAVAVAFPVAGTSHDPPALAGLSEVTADSYLGGTRRRSALELAGAIDDLAAVLDVGSGFDAAVARLSVLSHDLAPGISLLFEVLGEPDFPADEVDRSRRRQLDLLVEQRSEPDFVARERLLLQLYPGHPYGRLSASREALESLGRDDVVAFSSGRLDLSRAVVVLVGDVDPEEALDLCERSLPRPNGTTAPLPALAPPPEVEGLTFHLVPRPGSVQVNLLFARPALLRSDPRFPAAAVANQVLGGGASSRLFQVLREKRGLTYGAFSGLIVRCLGGHFAAAVDCRPEAAAEALDGLLSLLTEFAEDGPEETERERAARYLVGTFAVARETPGSIAQDEVTRQLLALPGDEWSTWRDRVSGASREECRRVAGELFRPDRGVVVAVGEREVLEPILSARGPTTVWEE